MPVTRLSLLAASVLIAVAVGVAAAPAQAGTSERQARSAIRSKLAPRYDRVERLTCKRLRRTSRLRQTCGWRASRRPTPNRLTRCRGRSRVTLRRRRKAKLRAVSRTRCSTRVDTLAPWLGFNDNAVRAGQLGAAQDAALTESVGAGITRLTFDWRYAEPRPGEFHLEDYDRIYAESISRGVRPLLVLAFAPGWARQSLLCFSDCRYPPAPEYYWAWRRIAATLAVRYPKAAGIEIWNEPNEAEFWNPGPSPRVYTDLLNQAYPAIKRANPAMRVVTGGFSNRRSDQGANLGLASFLRGIYASGARGSFDVLGFHAYPESPRMEALPHTLDAVAGIPARNGDGRTPLWVTETGMSTTDPDPRFRVTPAQQADGMAATIRALRKGGARVVLVHTLVDAARSRSPREPGYGMFRSDGTPKPAACTLAREAGVRRLPRGC